MRRFCGFPMGLITLPVVTPKARAKSISLGEMPYFPGKLQNKWRSHNSQGIIHKDCRKKSRREEHKQDKLIRIPCPGNYPAPETAQISAPVQSLSYTKGSEEKDKYININCPKCFFSSLSADVCKFSQFLL